MKTSKSINRRSFTQKTVALSTLAISTSRFNVLGANDRIRLGFIGVGGRGSYHLRQFLSYGDLNNDTQVTAIADPNQENLDQAVELTDSKAKGELDFRKVLDNKDVDAVVIASPDHWHAIQMILACQAGKDVYVEKPLGHTIEEQLRMIDAQKRYSRIVAVGMQQRSGNQFIETVERVQSGGIGKVNSVRCVNMWGVNGWLSNIIKSLKDVEQEGPPKSLDYDLWTGPAPLRTDIPAWANFYFFLDYAGGMMSGWGVHLFDIVMWAMGPQINTVKTTGGNFVIDAPIDTPDTAETLFGCPGYTFSYSLRHGNGFPNDPAEGAIDHGIYFHGTEGTILVNRNHAKLYREDDYSNPQVIPTSDMDYQHKRNFIDCVRSREQPAATVLDGHQAHVPGLLALISWQTGHEVIWDHEKQAITGDEQAEKLQSKNYRKPWVLPTVG